VSNDMGRMTQQVLAWEGEHLRETRAEAATCVRSHAVDEVEVLLFLDMLGLA
jgi:hypothetical protein